MKIYSLILIAGIFLFSACDSEVPVDPVVQSELLGLWEMHEQTGSQADICEGNLGELASFSSNGTAYFQCPGFDATYAYYTAENNVLTFTETGTQYGLDFPNDTNVIMTGVNVDRVLTYSRNLIYQK